MSGIFEESDEYSAAIPVALTVHYKSFAKVSSLSDRNFPIKFDLPLTEGTKKFIKAITEIVLISGDKE